MTQIDTKELRKHIEQLQEYSSKHSDVLHSLRSDFEDVNRYTQKILENAPYGNELMKILYKNEVDSLLKKMEGADYTFSYFKKSINRLHDDLDELEIELQNKVKTKAKVKAIKGGVKTFFVNFIGATSFLGVPTSFVMLLIAESHGSMYTGLIWVLVAAFCLATFLIILDRSDC